jgi:hypothetical protein
MTSELPPEYVAFVERHLETLREDAARVVGDVHDADRLYPLVLSAVAVRWNWLELQRVYLRNPSAADAYLERAFAKWSDRWQPDHILTDSSTIEVWMDEDDGLYYRPRPRYVSNAVKIASTMMLPPRPPKAAPLVEAAIAWYHAGEEIRKRRYLVIIAAIVAVLAVLLRISPPVT